MKYSIHFNQKAVIDLGLNLDVVDMCIFDFIKEFTNSGYCKKLIVNNTDIYYLISWSLINKELPILGNLSRQAIYKRLEKLKEAKVIEAHPDNLKMQQSYYKYGENYNFLIFEKKEGTCKENFTGKEEEPVKQSLQTCKENFTGIEGERVKQSLQYNNISNNNTSNNIKENTFLSKKEEEIKNKKIGFIKIVAEFVRKNPGKYPKLLYFEFCQYWLETSQNTKKVKLRFEAERFFDYYKRLATFNSICKNLEALWQKEDQTDLKELFNSLINK